MRVEDHAFAVLGVDQRSNKQEILNRAGELAFESDPQRVADCRLKVSHPARRLDVEVSWFPGIEPPAIAQLRQAFAADGDLGLFENQLARFSGLPRFNALAYWVGAHGTIAPQNWAALLPKLAESANAVNPASTFGALNSDRAAAGFPPLADPALVQEAIQRHMDAAADFLAGRLAESADGDGQVLTRLVEKETAYGKKQASAFLNKFVDRYQIRVQPQLEAMRAGIDQACDSLLAAAKLPKGNAQMEGAIDQIARRLTVWGRMALPIQMIYESRGLHDEHSIQVGRRVRRAAVDIANEFGLHQEAQRVTTVLEFTLESVPELAELVEKDKQALDQILARQAEQKKRDEEHRKAIELDLMIRRDRLQISDGIDSVQESLLQD